MTTHHGSKRNRWASTTNTGHTPYDATSACSGKTGTLRRSVYDEISETRNWCGVGEVERRMQRRRPGSGAEEGKVGKGEGARAVQSSSKTIAHLCLSRMAGSDRLLVVHDGWNACRDLV
ncbi:hypothetical protein Hypma_007013 [Hypsizygus marmoreus]|uniref:Uncharacterized protein n=1 Tax=Hypsizygus marmoreus TaxID=39966 RepID=A0A369K918_HYPMA|nr:hypothetical protein Hypma_007013 [Hypsizygus marmoreus]